MKLKGISWFEQHLEKVFACLFFAALLVVLALQFVGKESTVPLGAGKGEAPLSSAWERVGQHAREVQQKLASTATPEGDPKVATAPIVTFSERYRGPVSPSPTLAVAIGETSDIGESTVNRITGIAPLSPIQVPAPVSPVAASQLTLVAPFEAEVPEVAALLPPAMPFDKAGVTVEAEFPGTALYEALATDPDGPEGPVRAMPRHWIDGVQILAVELYREQLLPDGSWGRGMVLEPMPGRGRFSLRTELDKPIPGAAYLKDLARLATENAEFIRRPTYFQSWMGEQWMTPTERKEQDRRLMEMAGMGDDVRRLRDQADKTFNRLRSLQEQIDRLAGGGAQPPGERPRPSPPPNSGPGGKAPGGGGGGGGGGGRAPDGQRGDPNENRRRTLEAERDRVRRDLESIVTRLAAMKEDVSRYGIAVGEPAPAETPQATAAAEAPLLENPSVKVWAHDVWVERGATYRYQVRIVLNNPMFGQGNVMVPEQQELAKETVVRSEPSVWTEPVKVDDESYYFIVGASPSDRLMNRVASARAELYTFKWGRWRKGDTQLEPGDRVEASVKYPDLSVLLAAAHGGAPIVAGQPGRRDPTQPPPPSPIPNSSPHDNRQPPGNLPTAPERFEPPVRPGQPADPAAPPDPTSKPLPILSIDVKVDAIFLNVAAATAMPGSQQASSIVYLRDALGRIVTRLPGEEQVSGLLARLRRSAEQADQDLRPAAPIQPDNPVRPIGPAPRPPEEDSSPGGKSPGGGGA